MDWDHIEAVSFNLDSTLLQYERFPGEVLRRACEDLGVASIFPVEEYYARYDEFAEGHGSQQHLRAECFATLAAEHGADAEEGHAVAAVFTDEHDQSRVPFLPGAERALRAASDRLTAVITNGAANPQRIKSDALDADNHAEIVVVAGQTRRPDSPRNCSSRRYRRLG